MVLSIILRIVPSHHIEIFIMTICHNRTCQNFENRLKIKVFMAEMNFEQRFCISRGDYP